MEEIGIILQDKSIWWYVDFGDRYNVYNIRIQFKNYDGYCKYLMNEYMYNLQLER